MPVLLNGGTGLTDCSPTDLAVALADACVTEWRFRRRRRYAYHPVALADACVTEWRIPLRHGAVKGAVVALADACVTEWRGFTLPARLCSRCCTR